MKRGLFPFLLAAVMTLSACGAVGGGTVAGDSAQASEDAPSPATVGKLTAEEAHTRMQDGAARVILDVRTAEEYAEAHVPGAILLPNEDIGDTRPPQLPVLDTEILIYCRSGNRSAQAAKKLASLGYTNLYDFGGIRDWTYETESGPWEVEETAGTLSSFAAYDLSGVARDASIFSGHTLTMVNVWATYCGPCLRELPELGQLAAEYADRGVQVVGIVTDVLQNSDGSYQQGRVEAARALVEQTGASYLHLMPSADLISAKLNTVSGVPTTFFVDETGEQVGKVYVGARSGEAWGEIVDALLAEVDA
ncbi:rhodanese-like domain-containing protein [Oscillibacter sp.]|uniref:rhodanese-like domain-containing protein n=1 Tax=Oscillibacter sp. TaxID=1945593 RepID=UPI002628BC3D|nr:rhodanese-like domain-containing protein [Oscillibacter sp.]MDD3347991.1 rhodanese-like domain-containing protein [Oscillibacter sp.]